MRILYKIISKYYSFDFKIRFIPSFIVVFAYAYLFENLRKKDEQALNLKNCEMKEKIFANMSNRAADMIRDDLEAMGPVRLSEVETMQQSIVKIAMKLEEEGKLGLNSGGGDELV